MSNMRHGGAFNKSFRPNSNHASYAQRKAVSHRPMDRAELITNGGFTKQRNSEGRTGTADHGPQCLALLSEPTRKLALWAVCLPAAKAHKRRLRHTETAGPWRTDRACGPRPPVPNVAFWPDQKAQRNSRALRDGPGLRATAPSS